MPDPKHTVESIRAFLASGGSPGNTQARAMAAEYADLCREANFRLRRCADFLREGLRAEAVAYAGAKPSLLELVNVLQFNELPDWDRTCTAMNLPKPVRLALDAASHLNEAKRQQEPLEELLAKHRYLALARAEPAQRLEVLRQLLGADPASPCWKQEIQELEGERFATLRADAAAARKGDIVQVSKLLAELNAGRWLAPVPADLREILAKASTTLTEAAALARLRALVPRIRSACASMNEAQARQAFAEWGAVVQETKVAVPPELRQEILPLAHWIDEQDERREQEREFRAASATLSAALKANLPIEQLTRLYRAAIGFDFPLPEEMSTAFRRAQETARREQRAEKRRQYLLAFALIGLIALALGALVYVMFAMGSH